MRAGPPGPVSPAGAAALPAALALAAAAALFAPAPAAAQIGPVGARGEPAEARLAAMETVTEYVGAVREARRAEFEDAGRGREPTAREVAMQRRPAVIEALDRAALADPEDAWISGHRVGMRIKQGEREPALEAARECAAVSWWCSALEGFALHVLDRVPEAEAAFDRSLAEMPESVRCHWTEEVAELLEGEVAAEYRRLGCDARQAAMERVWWLADPLHLRPGNDRKTEHFARMVALQLHEQTLDLVNLVCVPEHRRSWLVLGVPREEWWSFEEPFEPFDEGPGARVVPGAQVFAAPFRSAAADWELRTERGSERHQAAYLPLRPLEQQTALFRRGDSLAVRIAASGEGAPGAALSRSASEPPVAIREPARSLSGGAPGGASGVLLAGAVPGLDPLLVSIEALGSGGDEAAGSAARARLGRALPAAAEGAVGLSDLLVFAPGERGAGASELEESLEAAEARMLSSLRIPAGTEIAIYWEAYNVTADRPLSLALTGLPGEPGLLRRLGQRLRLLSPRDAIEVGWTETPETDGRLSRVLTLDLAALEPGEYTLELHLEESGRDPVVTRRTIVVVEP